jgi:hypothetical protein
MNGRISMRSAVSGLLEHFPLQRQTFSSLRTARPTTRAERKLPFLGVFPLRVDDGTSFRLQSHGLPKELDLFWKGLYVHEPASIRLWVQLCRRSKVVFDIGANFGLYALGAAAVKDRSKGTECTAVSRPLEVNSTRMDGCVAERGSECGFSQYCALC